MVIDVSILGKILLGLVKITKKNFGPKVSYISAIGEFLYLAVCTRPDITFATNLFVRYNSPHTCRHWNGINHIFWFFQGTVDVRLIYFRKPEFGNGVFNLQMQYTYQIIIRLDRKSATFS